MRETGMNPYELMLSESQERMLIVLKPGRQGAGAQDLREVGARLRRHRPSHRHRAHGALVAWRHRRRHPDPAAGHRGAGL